MVDGVALRAHAGESLAAVLALAGRPAGRRGVRDGSPRGYWCGMGVCFECVVVVDGAPGQRACRVRVRDGMQVVTAMGDGSDHV
ncbi:MAG: (2Fe-2S)-binding protein [Chromatiales bacterium]|nr:(2Fe-2S)-binding protein [Chromatiales bacterium]